jgi:hypothetical protein
MAHSLHPGAAALLLGLTVAGCRDEEGLPPTTGTTELDIAVCDPAESGFTTVVDNPYFPLVVGSTRLLQGTTDGEAQTLEITVRAETETVAGVTTRVLEERESVAGKLVEMSRNFFVQARDGTVCYVTRIGSPYTVPMDDFPDTVTIVDPSPLDPGAESVKVFARGVGLIFDNGLELVGMAGMPS